MVVSDWDAVQQAWLDPGNLGENLSFRDFPAFHIMTLSNLAKAFVSRACLEPAGLSVPEWRLLTTLIGGAPVPFSHIAAQTLMDKGQISRTLRTAQGKGLVETAVVPLDRRQQDSGMSSIGRVVVRITEQGREVYGRVMPEAQRTQLRLIELMTPDERRMVIDLGRRIYARLSEELRGRS
jgi:DNA-binding MarR family transcriptional regulator